jgi:hypothetical protein
MRMFGIVGKKAKYEGLSWWENFMGGHISIGRVTIYGENAMHWAVEIKLKNTFMCFRLPFRCFGKWWAMYLYFSPNATPQNATWRWGKRNW